MANEIFFSTDSGQTGLQLVIAKTTGTKEYWETAGPSWTATYATAVADPVLATEDETSGIYWADWPATLTPSGRYLIIVLDSSDIRLFSFEYVWDDTADIEVLNLQTDTAHVWYVAKSGVDTNHGHSFIEAKLTLGAAITAASAGDTIVANPGTYVENVVVGKALTLLGSGRGKTIVQVSSGRAIHLTAGDCKLKGFSGITTDTGSSAIGITFGNTVANNIVEDCYGEGDWDGIHMGSGAGTNNNTLLNSHGKGNYDGIQLGSGDGRLVENCIGETTGSNAADTVQGIVSSGVSNVIMRNCKGVAKRATNGATENLIGVTLIGENILVENLVVDVDHTGTGDHTTTGLKLGGAITERITVKGLTGRVEATEGTAIGIQVANGNALVMDINLEAQIEGDGTVVGIDVLSGKVGTFIHGQVTENAPDATWSGTCTTGGGSGLEKKQFFDSSTSAISNDQFNGWELIWTSGSNLSETQLIDDFTNPGEQFDFLSDFTNNIAVGDAYEIYSGGAPTLYSLRNNGGTLIVSELAYTVGTVSGVVTFPDSETMGTSPQPLLLERSATDVSLLVKLIDKVTGRGATGVTIPDLNLTFWRIEDDNDATKIGPVDLTPLSALTDDHSDNKAIELSNGFYRVDVPDTFAADGAQFVAVTIDDDSGNIEEAALLAHLTTYSLQQGQGDYTHTITIRTTASVAVANANVWISSSSTGSPMITGIQQTDANGQVTVRLGDGTWYIFVNHSNYSFSPNPNTFVTTSGAPATKTLDIGTAISADGSSASTSTSSFLSRMISRIRLLLDEPAINKKYTDNEIILFIEEEYAKILQDLNRQETTQVVSRYAFQTTSSITTYQLPATTGDIISVGTEDTVNGTKSFFGIGSRLDSRGINAQIENNMIRFQDGNVPVTNSTSPVVIYYLPNGCARLFQGTVLSVTSASVLTFTVGVSNAIGTIDQRPNAYAGSIARILPATTSEVQQERIIQSSSLSGGVLTVTVENDFSPTPTGTPTFEIAPAFSQSLDNVVGSRVAFLLAGNEGNKERVKTMALQFKSDMRALRLAHSNKDTMSGSVRHRGSHSRYSRRRG